MASIPELLVGQVTEKFREAVKAMMRYNHAREALLPNAGYHGSRYG